MDDLVSMMRQGNSSQLEGAMEVVTEMVREDFGPDQLPTIASSLLPTLLDILRNEQVSYLLTQIGVWSTSDVAHLGFLDRMDDKRQDTR